MLYSLSRVKLLIELLLWVVVGGVLFVSCSPSLRCLKYQEIIREVCPSLLFYYFLLLLTYFALGLLAHSHSGSGFNMWSAGLLLF